MRPDHFFTSDLHFGDEHLLTAYEGRPFGMVDELAEAIVKRWNDTVGKRDVVWVLGDVTTDTGPSEHIARLHGTKYLIAGNHDTCSQLFTPDDRERAAIIRTWVDSGFRQVIDGSGIARSGIPIRIPLRGTNDTVALSHYPYDPAPWEVGKPDAFAPWRPKRPKCGPAPWLIHGHVHQAWATRGTQINVGADLWDFEPVPAEILEGLMIPAAE